VDTKKQAPSKPKKGSTATAKKKAATKPAKKATTKPKKKAATKRAVKPRKKSAKPKVSDAIEIIIEADETVEPEQLTPIPAKPKFDERRRNLRHTVDGLSGTFLFSTDARVIDLSLDGMSLETSAYLQIGRSYSLKLNHKKLEFPLRGIVQWCSLKRTARDNKGDVLAVYRAGLRFDNIFADKAKTLLEFLEENAVIRVEEQIRGRFKLPRTQSAGVTGTADFTVTTISLSGMSIETVVALAIDDPMEFDLQLGESSIAISGGIASSQEATLDDGQAIHRTGVEFVSQTAKSKRTLESFLHSTSD
jgi:hypothetical protein